VVAAPAAAGTLIEPAAGVAKRLIVDGMNLIGSRAGGWWRDRPGAMRALAEELAGYARRTGADLTLVFDGRPIDLPAEASEGIEVAFAPRGGRDAADDEIVRRVSESPEPEALAVVTSDRELARRVRETGANVISVRAFDGQL
jgi:predicted RNA-binding protein with PIN domain